MSDSSAPLTSFSSGEAPRPAEDPLAGDWSAGLPAPVRAHSIPEPRRIVLNGRSPRGADLDPSAAAPHPEALAPPFADLPAVSPAVIDGAGPSPFHADPVAPAGFDDAGAPPPPVVPDPVAPARAPFEAQEPPSFDLHDPAEWSTPVGSPADVIASELQASDVPMRAAEASTSEWAMPTRSNAPEALDVAPPDPDVSAWIAASGPPPEAVDVHDSAPTPWSEPVAAPASPATWEVPLDAAGEGDVPAWDAIPSTPAALAQPVPPAVPPPVLGSSSEAAPPPVLAPAPPPVLVPSAPVAVTPPVLVPSPPIAVAPPVLVPIAPPVLIPSESWLPDVPAAAAPPPVAAAPESVSDTPAADAAPVPDSAWDAPPPPADSTPQWQPEAAGSDWQEVKKPQAPSPEGAAADWSSLKTGPDWSASATPSPDVAPDAWGAPPPAPDPSSEWAAPAAAAPADVEWSPPPPAAEPHWSAPAAPAPAPAPEPAAPAPAWNAPAVGASALEQLDSEPAAPEPGAAKELFGSVPAGGSLSGDDDEFTRYDGLGANDSMGSADALGPPVELASPEEVLRPLDDIDHDDPDLPATVEKSGATPARAQPLAAWRPAASGALEVRGEHRVAVHTRGGRTMRGSLRDIDLSKSQFPLLPQGGGNAESIYHSDVKAIFFMLAPGEKPHAGDGGKVRVTFADGRVIEGTREGADAKHGFFLVPADAARTNTRRIYVVREATSHIENG
jgi:hypothetical protein